MLKAKSLECRQQTPANDAEIHDKATVLWKEKGKALIDPREIMDNQFKQQVITYANNKYGKAKP
jgi:uncharacterized protein YabE (DUF348 family)